MAGGFLREQNSTAARAVAAEEHLPGRAVKRHEEVLALIGVRMKRGDARARLAVTMRHHLAGAMKHGHGLSLFRVAAADSVIQALKMKADPGKALSESVVHLMCQTLALANDCCYLPALEAQIKVDSPADEERL